MMMSELSPEVHKWPLLRMRSENMAKIALHTVQCLSCFSSGIQLPAYKDTTEFTVCRSFNDV